jgi:methylated-DNA-[protein]-cysteine S-methyltransferase
MVLPNLSKPDLGRVKAVGRRAVVAKGSLAMPTQKRLCVAVFATDLGWMALAGAGATVAQITFARRSKAAALAALDPEIRSRARALDWNPSLVRRLVEYAAGAADDFRDIQLDLDHLTPFQRRIVKYCRAIGYGQTQSYGELAAAAGSPRAARAVGNTMAANRFALVVPCHRVVHGGGGSNDRSPCARLRAQLRDIESGLISPPPKRVHAAASRRAAESRGALNKSRAQVAALAAKLRENRASPPRTAGFARRAPALHAAEN